MITGGGIAAQSTRHFACPGRGFCTTRKVLLSKANASADPLPTNPVLKRAVRHIWKVLRPFVESEAFHFQWTHGAQPGIGEDMQDPTLNPLLPRSELARIPTTPHVSLRAQWRREGPMTHLLPIPCLSTSAYIRTLVPG